MPLRGDVRLVWYARLEIQLTEKSSHKSGSLLVSSPLQITIFSAGLFVACMVCHGEVYRLRPDPAYLTSFYLSITAGGAIGGVFVAVIAPLIFTEYLELDWGLILCGAPFLFSCLRTRNRNTL